jgi:hypothetical protein
MGKEGRFGVERGQLGGAWDLGAFGCFWDLSFGQFGKKYGANAPRRLPLSTIAHAETSERVTTRGTDTHATHTRTHG